MLNSKIATSCEDLMMDKFILCSVDNDYSHLIIKKGIVVPNKEKLREAWIKIYEDYTDLSSGNEGNAYLSLLKQKFVLSNKINMIAIGLEALSYRRHPELIKMIRKLGIKGSFSEKTFDADLRRGIVQLKSLVARLEKVEKNMLPYITGESTNKKDFSELMAVLSKFQGYRIDPKDTSVLEFVNILNNFKKWQTPKKSPK